MSLQVWGKRFWVIAVLAGLLLGSAVPAQPAQARLEACDVSVTPTSAATGNTTNFSFTVTNNSSSSIQWVKITVPTGNYFTVKSGSAAGWGTSISSRSITFASNSLPPPYDQVFDVEASSDAPVSNASWTVEASDDPSGTIATDCSGNTQITNTSPPISISNVRVSNLTSSSATIQWNTNTASTSQVFYGTTTGYGQSTTKDNTAVTSHSVTLAGLNASTGYHFQVVSTNTGNTTSSLDSTFLTAADPSTGGNNGGNNTGQTGASSSSNTTTPTSSSAATATGTPITDKVAANTGLRAASLGRGIAILDTPIENAPPVITVNGPVPKVVKTMPTISGNATDDNIVARIEYSTDNGSNWLPVDSSTGLGSKAATYRFTPAALPDGDYELLVRAIDVSGNVGVTEKLPIVVDQLSPQVGGNVLALGPQILNPGSNGTIISLAGLDQKITLSAIGGPNAISLQATKQDATAKPQIFSLTKSADTGLWSGVLSFATTGKYNLLATAFDGAGNKTTRVLNPVYIYSAAQLVDARSDKPLAGLVTIYTQEQDTNRWVKWDGASYGQANPQTTDKTGGFEYLLPPGRYYASASADGYRTTVSDIFSVAVSQPLTTTIKLQPESGVKVGSLRIAAPSLSATPVTLGKAPAIPQKVGQGSAIGRQAPDFTLPDTAGNTIRSADLLGKPTLLSFSTTWAPGTSEQVTGLATLQKNPNFNVLPVGLQENAAKLGVYADLSGQPVRWLVDANSSLSNRYTIQSVPTHYFIDRKGVVRQVLVGVLSQQKIQETLSGL